MQLVVELVDGHGVGEQHQLLIDAFSAQYAARRAPG